jgi:Fe-S-cluster containining protein
MLECLDAGGVSLEDATARVRQDIGNRGDIIWISMLSSGHPKTVEGCGDTVQAAITSCEHQCSTFVAMKSQRVRDEPRIINWSIKADTEAAARTSLQARLDDSRIIKRIQLTKRGRRGVFGLGRTPNHYTAEILQQAVVSVTFLTEPVLVRALYTVTEPRDEFYPQSAYNQVTITDQPRLLDLIERCGQELERWIADKRSSIATRDLYPYLPGSPEFMCLMEKCTKSCCKNQQLTIIASESFQDRVKATMGLVVRDFVDFGFMQAPFLQKDKNGKCVFLDEDHKCKVYGIRPTPCVLYPFELAFFDLQRDGSLRIVNHYELYEKAGLYGDREDPMPTFLTEGGVEGYNFLIPLIVYHTECPGFGVQPISLEKYLKLVGYLWRPFRITPSNSSDREPTPQYEINGG